MSAVERFDCTQDSSGWELGPAYMSESNDGDYVQFADYEKLAQQVEQMRTVFENMILGRKYTNTELRAVVAHANAALAPNPTGAGKDGE